MQPKWKIMLLSSLIATASVQAHATEQRPVPKPQALSGPAVSANKASDPVFDDWAWQMSLNSPTTQGCFTADYPSLNWTSISCDSGSKTAAQEKKAEQKVSASGGFPRGWMLQTPTPITQAIGYFPFYPGISEGFASGDDDEDFSNRLTTNYMDYTCNGTPCQISLQFVLETVDDFEDGTIPQLYIKYRVKNYCPAGWTQNGDECSFDSPRISLQTIVEWPQVASLFETKMYAFGGRSGLDGVVLQVEDSTLYAVTSNVPWFDVSKGWTSFGYNAVGVDGSSNLTFLNDWVGLQVLLGAAYDNFQTAKARCLNTVPPVEGTNELQLGACRNSRKQPLTNYRYIQYIERKGTPTAPVITQPADLSTLSPGDTISGTGEPGALIVVYVDGDYIGGKVARACDNVKVGMWGDEEGQWSCTVGALPEGKHTLNAVQGVLRWPGKPSNTVNITVAGSDTTLDDWAWQMALNSPTEPGCFSAQYPDTVWRDYGCFPAVKSAPKTDNLNKAGSKQVGGQSDWTLEAPASIKQAVGHFPYSPGVPIGFYSLSSDGQTKVDGAFSYQLTTNTINTTCNSAPCSISLQFLLEGPAYGTQMYMQYWAAGFCPAGWSDTGNGTCFYNTPTIRLLTNDTGAYDLLKIKLYGFGGRSANGQPLDGIVVQQTDTLWAITSSVPGFDISNGWTSAEFNMLGGGKEGDALGGEGSELYFVADWAGLDVILGATYDNNAAPSCAQNGTSSEKSELTAGPCAIGYSKTKAQYPYIQFIETKGQPTYVQPPYLATILQPATQSVIPYGDLLYVAGTGYTGSEVRVMLDGKPLCTARAATTAEGDARPAPWSCASSEPPSQGMHILTATQGVGDMQGPPSNSVQITVQ